ncbi:type II toxin-antitoxin system HicA family toxin [Candidatus Woesearchaeota archaeon]|nr:type II toxin-antitoxin system HicA family toxin [Candidatus Woesearchaeota archaeon]
MSKQRKVFDKIMAGKSDANIDFADLCHLLRQLDFVERTKGSHHVFKKPDVPAIVLQADSAKAKTYQVRQVRDIFKKFKIEVNL